MQPYDKRNKPRRLILWIGALLVVIAAFATAALDSSAQASPTPVTATLDKTAQYLIDSGRDFYVTATAIMAGATATAEAATSAERATDRYLIDSGQESLVTATALVREATATAFVRREMTAAQLAPTDATNQYLIDTGQDFYVTATAIIAGATQTVAAQRGTRYPLTPAPTATLIPTLSAQEFEDLRLHWITELETAAGFSHPVFDPIANSLVEQLAWLIDYSNQRSARLRHNPRADFQINLETRETTYGGDTYLALNIQASFLHNQLLIFWLAGDLPTLIFDSDVASGNYLWLTLSGMYVDRDLGGFADRNGNGLPELVLENNPGGASCNRETLTVLEIQPGGQVADITPERALRVFLDGFVDLDGDGVLEIEASEWFFDKPQLSGVFCDRIEIKRYYSWNGTAYVDISGTLGEAYYPDIQAYWDSVAGQDGCLLPNYDMYRMLVSNMAMGRLHEGWSRLAPLLRWEQCFPSVLTASGEDIGQFITWMGKYLELEAQAGQ